MSRSVFTIIVYCSLVVLASSSHTVSGQEKGVAPPAPVPAQIFTAKNVFISNGGVDGLALPAFRRLGDVDQPYDAFYAAMKEWGKYALVFSPAQADLVFEIRFIAQFNGDERVVSYVPQFNLTIYDAKTRFALWTVLAPVEGALRKDTFIRNVNRGIASLIGDLKNLQGRAGNSVPDPASSAQAVGARQPDRASVGLITDFVNNEHPAITEIEIKQLTWMGDSAAAAIIQVIGTQTVDQPKLGRILGILRAAFERPAIIKNAADRNPSVTFALLDQLQQDPSRDASALAEIDSTRQYVIGALKNSK